MESGDKGKTNPKDDVSSIFSLSLVKWINKYNNIDTINNITIVIVVNNSFANVIQNNLWETRESKERASRKYKTRICLVQLQGI